MRLSTSETRQALPIGAVASPSQWAVSVSTSGSAPRGPWRDRRRAKRSRCRRAMSVRSDCGGSAPGSGSRSLAFHARPRRRAPPEQGSRCGCRRRRHRPVVDDGTVRAGSRDRRKAQIAEMLARAADRHGTVSITKPTKRVARLPLTYNSLGGGESPVTLMTCSAHAFTNGCWEAMLNFHPCFINPAGLIILLKLLPRLFEPSVIIRPPTAGKCCKMGGSTESPSTKTPLPPSPALSRR